MSGCRTAWPPEDANASQPSVTVAVPAHPPRQRANESHGTASYDLTGCSSAALAKSLGTGAAATTVPLTEQRSVDERRKQRRADEHSADPTRGQDA